MASLDVEGLFTNIPLEETIDICTNLLFSDKDKAHGLEKEEFRTLLTLATKESLILFDGCYYQQIDGVAMGSPLGPTFANIFLCYHEGNWLSACPPDIKPSFYRRYVDDIFLLFDNLDQVERFKAYMNTRHKNMKFTSEIEENDILPFLDIKVIRVASAFITSVYRKPTFSGVYTNYNSFLPLIYKTGLIRTLLFRLYTICSDWNMVHSEIEHLKSVMKRNAYPDRLIDTTIKRFLCHLFVNRTATPPQQDSRTFQLYLPFLGTLSSKTEKSINKAFKQYLPTCKVKIITSASVRLKSLFKFKDMIPTYLQSGVVYKFECGICNDTYIGETKRHIKTRYCEQLGFSPLTGKPSKPKPSPVQDHLRSCSNTATPESFTIIGRDSNNWHLNIKESLFIRKDRPTLNGQESSVPLKLFKN